MSFAYGRLDPITSAAITNTKYVPRLAVIPLELELAQVAMQVLHADLV
jgi:hypothetical protein